MTVGSATSLVIDRIVTPVARMHRSISGRWFDAAGQLGKPIRPVHDAITTTVYGSIRLAGSLAGVGIDAAVAGGGALTARTQAIVNGLWGDELGRNGTRLEIPMTLRDHSGAVIELDRLAAGFPTASGHIAILVHGFADTESCWLARGDQEGLTTLIADQTGRTPILVRYNTGLPVAANGALLAGLLDRLHSAWPVPVESVALVGHSMGGLVVRHACESAANEEHGWLRATSEVVALAAPHLGSPIEKLVSVLAGGLGLARETEPLQDFVNTRSQGIKDLGFGSPPAALPGEIREHFVAGVVTTSPSNPLGSLLGDFVVRVPSASGGATLKPSNVLVVSGVRHNQLVRDRDVVAHILGWLQPDTE